jgi:hypothetical protein
MHVTNSSRRTPQIVGVYYSEAVPICENWNIAACEIVQVLARPAIPSSAGAHEG